MIIQYSTMQEYEVYLQDRARDYQAAQAASELIQAWFGAALYWVASRLVAWGQGFNRKGTGYAYHRSTLV